MKLDADEKQGVSYTLTSAPTLDGEWRWRKPFWFSRENSEIDSVIEAELSDQPFEESYPEEFNGEQVLTDGETTFIC